jgi:hypothetical protein
MTHTGTEAQGNAEKYLPILFSILYLTANRSAGSSIGPMKEIQ